MEEVIPYTTGNDYRDICLFIGAMTLSWAWVENTLGLTISIITDKFGEIEGHSEAPLSLKRKVQCFRKALKSISQLDGLKERGSLLAERLLTLGDRRNNLVHGAMWRTHEGDIKAISLKVVKGEYTAHEESLSVSDAIRLDREIAKLSDDMTAFMIAVDGIIKTC